MGRHPYARRPRAGGDPAPRRVCRGPSPMPRDARLRVLLSGKSSCPAGKGSPQASCDRTGNRGTWIVSRCPCARRPCRRGPSASSRLPRPKPDVTGCPPLRSTIRESVLAWPSRTRRNSRAPAPAIAGYGSWAAARVLVVPVQAASAIAGHGSWAAARVLVIPAQAGTQRLVALAAAQARCRGMLASRTADREVVLPGRQGLATGVVRPHWQPRDTDVGRTRVLVVPA